MLEKKETIMDKGVVILLEDESSITEGFKSLFDDLDIELDLICCDTYQEFDKKINDLEIRGKLRGLIMDLSNSQKEFEAKRYEAGNYIESEYNNNRIPIFIHSGNLEYYNEFNNKGTVFKISKSKDSTTDICKTIQLMQNSKFLDIFCENGLLEKKIMNEIHSAFIEQFKGNEIKDIIESIANMSGNKLQSRTIEVFERIALRAVYENWISAKNTGDGLEEVQLNSVEHYYRRTSGYKIWTGDVFSSEKTNNLCVVLTPRCNLGHGNIDNVLLCKIIPIDKYQPGLEAFGSKKKGQKNYRGGITDDVTNHLIGERFRFLPHTPQFIGGFVDYKTVFTLSEDEFLGHYERVISLSDELTNDVVRKYSSYILRGGISETEFNEAYFYFLKNVMGKHKA